MDAFFNPRSIIVFGATSNEKKSGNRVLRNILNYTKENVYIINPKSEEIYGIKCFKRIFDLPTKSIDLAIIILPVEVVLDALEDCIDFGVKAVIVESGSLYIKDENYEKNKIRVQKIHEKLKKSGKTRVMGPNSIGICSINSDSRNLITSLIYFESLPALKKRNLAVVSQTGLTLSGLLQRHNYIQEIGFSKIAAIGNKWDINESDVLDFIRNDQNTHVIALYLEDIKNGKRFMNQCREIAKTKPIILLKSGKTEKGKKAIVSHTKSLAGDYKIIEALSKQVGIITVEDFEELFVIAKMILGQAIPKGNKVGVISISGAGTVLSCDLTEKYKLELPPLTPIQLEKMKKVFPKWAWEDVYNPLDIWAAVEFVGPNEAYKTAGEVFLEGRNIDTLVYFITGIKESEFDWKILNDLNKRFPDIPIYFGWFGGDKQLLLKWREVIEEQYQIPTFDSIHVLMENLSKIIQITRRKTT